MLDSSAVGKLVILIGGLVVLFGVVMVFAGKWLPIGRLPGDFVIRSDNLTIYLPLTTMIIVSIVLSLALGLVWRWVQ